MDAGIAAAIATGTCAITLVIIKYMIGCLCPGHVDCTIKSGCSKPNEINPLVTLKTLWEEKWNPEHERLGKNLYRFAEKNMIDNTWDVNIKDNTEMVHLYREDDPKPESGNHFLKVKIKLVEGNPDMNLFIKRYTGDANCWDACKEENWLYKEPIIFNIDCRNNTVGTCELFKPSLVGKADVTHEQVGLTIKGKGKYIIEEAYYSGNKLNILSCPKCCYSFYKCHNPQPKSFNDDQV